ncbi:MAG: peptidylprolyl isomerase [Gammaproteobacteria bacterium]
MNKKLISLLLTGSALLAACEQSGTGSTTTGKTAPQPTATAPAITKEQAVAVVNGQFISKAALENLQKEIAQRNGGQSIPAKTLLEELVKQEILIQEANKENLQNSPEVVNRLETIKRSLLSQAALQKYLDAHPITDADLKAEYDKKVGSENAIEYKARHILLKTEAEAKKIIEQLKKGAKFEDLAKKNSTEPGAKESGGDLGWFTANQMVAPFSEAVVAMENGKYSTTPVQTQFGWHVILREDSRTPTPPPFESVKEQLRPMLQREKIQAYIESLRNQAKVETFLPEEKPAAPAVENAPAPAAESKPADPNGAAAPEQAAAAAEKAEPASEKKAPEAAKSGK